MKAKYLIPLFTIAACLALPLAVLAQDDNNDQGDDSQIQGTESFEAKFILTGTTNAPAASGVADIESEDDNGAVTGTMEIETSGLPAGDYQVSVIKQSDGSNVVIGPITVGGSEDDNSQGDETNSVSDSESETDLTLPAGFDLTDIAQLVVADTNGVQFLIGSLANSSSNSLNFNATIQVSPGAAGPNVQGVAVLHSQVHKGKVQNRFMLNATGAPANSTLTVLVNGTPVSTVKSSKSGHIKLNKLPVNALGLKSVELQDGSGNTVATANF